MKKVSSAINMLPKIDLRSLDESQATIQQNRSVEYYRKRSALQSVRYIQTDDDGGIDLEQINKNIIYKKALYGSKPKKLQIRIQSAFMSMKNNNQDFTNQIQNLIKYIQSSRTIYQYCRLIQSNANQLIKAFMMLSPQFNLYDNNSVYKNLRQKISSLYDSDNLLNEYYVIQLTKIMKVFTYLDLNIKQEKLIAITSIISLLYHDTQYGYYTHYLYFAKIISKSVQIHNESTKIFMQSLLPKYQQQQDLNAQSPNPKKRINKLKPIQSVVNKFQSPKNNQIKSLFHQTIRFLGFQDNSYNSIYNAKQDLKQNYTSSNYQFYGIQCGFINVSNNPKIIQLDSDLQQQSKIFGITNNEYPVWVRCVYQNREIHDDYIYLQKQFLIHNDKNKNQHNKDFYQQLDVQDSLGNSYVNQVGQQNRLQTISQNSIVAINEGVIKQREELSKQDIWNITNENIIDEIGNLDNFIMNSLGNYESVSSDEQSEHSMTTESTLLVKQIQSYRLFIEQLNINGGIRSIVRNQRHNSIVDKYLGELMEENRLKKPYQFKEQFLNDQAKNVYPYNDIMEQSEDEYELSELPIELESNRQPTIQKQFAYLKAQRTQSYTLSEPQSNNDTTIIPTFKNIPKVKPNYKEIQFLLEQDLQITPKLDNDYKFILLPKSDQSVKNYPQQKPTQSPKAPQKLQSTFILDSYFYHSLSPTLLKQSPQSILSSSNDTSIQEQPIYFSEIPQEQELIADQNNDIWNGMIIHTKDIPLSYEEGSGIDEIQIHYKKNYISKLQGFLKKKPRWEINLFTRGKFQTKTTSIEMKGKNAVNLQLKFDNLDNKSYLKGFEVAYPIEEKIQPQEIKQSPRVQMVQSPQTRQISSQQKNKNVYQLDENQWELDSEWNKGAIEVIVQTIPQNVGNMEIIKDKLNQLFPSIVLLENYLDEDNEHIYQIWIKGVGPVDRRMFDNLYPLYQSKEFQQVDEIVEQIYDEICLLCLTYDNTKKLKLAQDNHFLRKFN